MAQISISEFRGETVVVHFGGDEKAINAYTFAQSLTGFADTARAISSIADPGQEIEIVIVAVGGGSFRTTVRRVRKEIKGVFSGPVGIIFWGIVTNIVYDNLIKPADRPPQIIINSNEVIIKHGAVELIVPRETYDAAENAKKNPDVQEGLKRTFQPLVNDSKVTEFGLTTHIDDPEPIVTVPREMFDKFIQPGGLSDEISGQRLKNEKARVVILKAWLNHANRKWSFEWNGVPLSAPIIDKAFLDRLAKRQHLIGAGDALDVEITFRQVFDENLRVYVNDPHSYVISRVFHHVPNS